MVWMKEKNVIENLRKSFALARFIYIFIKLSLNISTAGLINSLYNPCP